MSNNKKLQNKNSITLTTQSTKPLYILASGGWFIRRVRTMSKGATVVAMKKPAPKAAKNCVKMPR